MSQGAKSSYEFEDTVLLTADTFFFCLLLTYFELPALFFLSEFSHSILFLYSSPLCLPPYTFEVASNFFHECFIFVIVVSKRI